MLGFSDMAGYTSAEGRGKNPYMGAVVGRVANRVAEAKFSLDGEHYSLAQVRMMSLIHVIDLNDNARRSTLGSVCLTK